MTVSTDIAIIGAGPVGLFAVFACGQLGMHCAVIDALDDPGGQLSALYPEKPIYDIPGRPQVRADALVADLCEQAAPYEPAWFLGQTAERLETLPDGRFRIRTSRGRIAEVRAIIIAAGVGAFGPNRPPIEGIRAYEGVSVFYHVARRERFRGLDLVIAGGGDSAVDWALSLAEVARSVSVIHRRDVFRAHPASVAALRADQRIEVVAPWQLAGLEGAGGHLSAVRLAPVGAGETVSRKADALIALFGLAGDLTPLAGFGVAIDGKVMPVDPATCQTNVPGIFAIGDVAAYPGKRKLILTGFAEAASAALAAHSRARPGVALHDEYSTTRGVPGLKPALRLETA
jgi:thioredoxin reductase (NADPH)